MPRTILQIDAFTDHLFGGNPAGVLLDARGLDDRTMQAIAREMACSETAFVLPATRADCTHRVRFFTPGEEVPMCGHATIATFLALATRGAVADAATMECGAGALPIAIARDGERVLVTMTQNAGSFAEAPSRARVAASIGLGEDDLAPSLPVEFASTGLWIAVAPVRDRAALTRARPDAAAIRALATRDARPDGVYAVLVEEARDGAARARARFFCGEGLGIGEDPVTGSAAGALAAWMHRHGRLAVDRRLVVAQGEEAGRAGTVVAAVGADGRARITGTGVQAFEATINV